MKRYLAIILCFIFLLSGCQSGTADEETIIDYSKLVQKSADIDFGDIAYNIEMDSQNYYNFSSRQYAAVQDGYYVLKSLDNLDFLLVFIDKNTLKCMPVCSKADCMHENSDCDAYFDESPYLLNYYDGSLYTVLDENDESAENYTTTYYLCKISLDGSVREKVFDIYSAEESGSSAPQFIVHRGYIYYLYENGEKYYMVKRDINGDNPQEIYSIGSEVGIIDNINGYGDGVLFCVQGDRTKAYSNAILYYSTITEGLYEIADNVYWQYAATEDSLVYADGRDIYKTNIDRMTKELFIEGISGMVSIKYDGRYLYVDNEGLLWNFEEPEESDYSNRKIDVYDLEGKLVDTIPIAGQDGTADIGDEKYMFFDFYENGNWIKRAFDKSQIGTGKYEWTEI